MAVNPQGEITIRFKKAKIVRLMLMGLVMTAASIAICFMPEGATPYPSGLLRVLGIFGVVFFGLGSLVYVAQFFGRRPALVVDREGIIDNTTYPGVGRVLWADVKGLRVGYVRKVPFLIVDVHDPEKFLPRGNMFQRFLRASSARMVGSPISLAATSLDADFDQLAALIERAHQQAVGLPLSPPASGV